MENIVLAGRDAAAFLTSSYAKQIDCDFETALYISGFSSNYMAYLPGAFDYTSLFRPIEGRPRIARVEAMQLASTLGKEPPIHVVVDSLENRRNSKRLNCSVLPEGVTGEACFFVSEGLHCVLPELALVQAAKGCTDIQLIVLMSLMFGVFAKDRESGNLVPRRSVTTPAGVLSFIERCEADGEKRPDDLARIKKLLPQAVQKAASPKEIECALRLGREIEQGGCGFGLPEMNYRLEIAPSARSRYCDLYWPTQNVAVEYRGANEHAGVDALEADALHCNDLTSINVPIFNITAGQLGKLTLFNRVARQIERQLKSYRAPRSKKRNSDGFPNSAEFHDKQRRLKDEIGDAFRLFGF